MLAIICLDDNLGMLFNQRRQSQDKVLTEKIAVLTKDRKLWMNSYSYNLFKDVDNAHINVEESFLSETPNGDYCFVEDKHLKLYEQWIEKLIVFKWNRKYPADLYFDIELDSDKWVLSETEEFKGNSHEKITMEVYTKC